MSFSIGGGGMGGGPRGMIHRLGSEDEGKAFDHQIVLRLLGFVKPHWRAMLLAMVLMLISSLLGLAIPYLMKEAIDTYMLQDDLQGLNRVSILTAIAFAGFHGIGALQGYVLSRTGQSVLAEMRENLVRHLQAIHLGYHNTHIIGVTISRVFSDVGVINELLSQGLITLVGDIVTLTGIVIVMVQMNARLALYSFTVLPVMVIATTIFARHAKQAFRETRATNAEVVGDLAESLNGMRVIQAFGQESMSQERFDEVNRANRDANVNAMRLSFIFMPVVGLLSTAATAIVLFFGGRAVATEELTLGIVVAFLSYVTRFFTPIRELSQLYTTMQSAMAGGERVLALLDTVPAVADKPDAEDIQQIHGDVELRHVDFEYVANTPVLRDVNLKINAGQTVALVGPTGAGKTSISNLVARFYDATHGQVLIDGLDVRDVKQQSLRKQMGIVPQDPFLFSGTIADNIRFGEPDAGMEAVEQASRLSNVHDFVLSLEKGYETEIQEGGVNLSLGQRQLLCIARAVLADPRILILDEATSSVDTVTEVLIQEALDRLLAGRTAIVIAHRLSTIRNADIICVIDDGRIVEQGSHEELLAIEDGLYHDLYERQFVNIA